MPEHIAVMLGIVQVLLGYGRHIAATIEHRALRRGFATIAQFFGTAAVPVMLAHIQRGIMRAVALERVLLERAKRGRDLVIPAPREPSRPAAPPPPGDAVAPDPGATAAPQPAETPAGAAHKMPRPPRQYDPEEPLTLANLPSMAQIEAEVRRDPFGRSLVNILRDLGIAPTLCEGTFWTRLMLAIPCFGGSLNTLLGEMRRREKRLEAEQWKQPKLGWPEETRDGVRRVLGFFIGEPPVDPFGAEAATVRSTPVTPALAWWTITAAATGPP